MRHRRFRAGIAWRLISILVLAFCLVFANVKPALAINPSDYFSYSYNVQLSKTEVHGREIFFATVTGQATCEQDLPLAISSAYATSRIIAQHQASGTEVVLNSSYTVTFDSVPNTKGGSTQASVSVPLVFPDGSQDGTYTVVGQIVEAKVQVFVWIDITQYLPSSQAIGTVTYVSDSGDGGGGEGGLSNYIDDTGRFIQGFTIESADGKVRLTISENTTGLTGEGEPLSEITVVEMAVPPPPPVGTNIIGLVYDLIPDGATFDPPITICITYDESLIPAGVAEEDLVLAVWDEVASEWVILEGSVVDPTTNTICAPIDHFTLFAVLAFPPPPPAPAAFVISDLSIAPTEVDTGETVTISALITNTGDLSDSYEVTLRINDVVVDTKEVTVDGGDSVEVPFTTAQDVAGTYTVNVDGLSDTFTVKAPLVPPSLAPAAFVVSDLSIAPTEVDIGETITISALITNTGDLSDSYEVTLRINDVVVDTKEVTLGGGANKTVTFTTSQGTARAYAVTIDDLSGTFTVKKAVALPPPVVPARAINWWLIAGIAAAVVIINVVIWYVISTRAGRRA